MNFSLCYTAQFFVFVKKTARYFEAQKGTEKPTLPNALFCSLFHFCQSNQLKIKTLSPFF
jgi:hypothetical protein